MEERLAWLESKIEDRRWWRNPGWWGVILSTLVGLSGLVWQTKPWEAFEDSKPGTVKLIEGHAAGLRQESVGCGPAGRQWDVAGHRG